MVGLSPSSPPRSDFFPWGDVFLTGLAEIDGQHKNIVGLLNEAAMAYGEGGNEGALAECLEKLETAFEQHFLTEESLWIRALGKENPSVQNHLAEHEEIREALRVIRGRPNQFWEKAAEALWKINRWAALHMLVEDQLLAKAALEIGSGKTRDEAMSLARESHAGTPRDHGVVSSLFLDSFSRSLQLVKSRLANEEARIEQKVALAEEKFDKLLGTIPDAIFVVDQETGIIAGANEAAGKLFGKIPEDLVGAHFTALHPPELHGDVSRGFRLLQTGAATGEGGKANDLIETRIRHASGQDIPVELHASPGHESGGRLYLVGVFRDIRERKKMEGEMELLRHAMEAAAIPIMLVDALSPDFPLIYANPAFTELTGFTREDAIGKNCRFLQGGDRDQPDQEKLREALKNGTSARALLRNYRKDGSMFWNQLAIAPLRDADGRISHYVGFQIDMTWRKLIEAELHGALSRLEALVAASPDFLLVLDRSLRIVDCHPKDPGRYLVSPEVFLGKSIAGIVPKNIADLVETMIPSVLARNSPDLATYDLDYPDGLRHFEARFFPHSGDRVVCVVRDITAKKEAEDRLFRESQILTALSGISSKFIDLPPDELDTAIDTSLAELGRFFPADRACIFLYDFEAETCTNTHEWRAGGTGPQIRNLRAIPLSTFAACVEHHKLGKTVHIPDISTLPPDDPLRALFERHEVHSSVLAPLMDGEKCAGFVGLGSVSIKREFTGSEQRLLAIFADSLVNLRKRIATLDELAEQKRFLADIIDNSGTPIYVKEPSGKYLNTNPSWEKATGIPKDAAIGKTDEELFPEAVAAEYRAHDLSVLAAGKVLEVEERIPDPAGERSFLSAKFPVRDSSGNIFAIAGMSTEITAIKRAAADRTAREVAEAEGRTRIAFLAKMSHEIRTPLNAIIGFARLLERELPPGDEPARQVSTILRSADQLLEMVNELLDFGKLESGNMPSAPEDFRLRDMFEGIAAMFRPRTQEKGIDLVLDCDEALPAGIRADQTKIRLTVINLVGNAVKFTRTGSVTLRSRKLPDPENRPNHFLLEVEIEDTGPGVPLAEVGRLFDEFFVGVAGRSAGGTGLGLPICRGLVESMGGSISVRRRNGGGAVFRFEIPASEADVIPPSYCPDLPPSAPGERGDSCAPVRQIEKSAASLLPPSIVEQMQSALSSGDMPEMRALLASLKNDFPELAERLIALSDRYDYEALEKSLAP